MDAIKAADQLSGIGGINNANGKLEMFLHGGDFEPSAAFDDKVKAFAESMCEEFEKSGVKIDRVYEIEKMPVDGSKSFPSTKIAFDHNADPVKVRAVLANALNQSKVILSPEESADRAQFIDGQTIDPEIGKFTRGSKEADLENEAKNRPTSRFSVFPGGMFREWRKGKNKGGPVVTDIGYDDSIEFATNEAGEYIKDPALDKEVKYEQNADGQYVKVSDLGKKQEIIRFVFGNHPDTISHIIQVGISKTGRPTFLFDTGEKVQAVYHNENGKPKLNALVFPHDHVDMKSGQALLHAMETAGHSLDDIQVHGTKEFKKNMEKAIAHEKAIRYNKLLGNVDSWKQAYKDEPDTMELLQKIGDHLNKGTTPISVVTNILNETVPDKHNAAGGPPDFERMAKMLSIQDERAKNVIIAKPKMLA